MVVGSEKENVPVGRPDRVREKVHVTLEDRVGKMPEVIPDICEMVDRERVIVEFIVVCSVVVLVKGSGSTVSVILVNGPAVLLTKRLLDSGLMVDEVISVTVPNAELS